MPTRLAMLRHAFYIYIVIRLFVIAWYRLPLTHPDLGLVVWNHLGFGIQVCRPLLLFLDVLKIVCTQEMGNDEFDLVICEEPTRASMPAVSKGHVFQVRGRPFGTACSGWILFDSL